MTVSSLWTVLDEAGCGRPVGIEDFDTSNTSNINSRPTILAVDTSIWICEGISSTALSSFHSDPALYLVYQRTTKLLKLGLGLVFVLEGKRRVRSTYQSSEHHELKQRRSGSQFWSATERCESLLRLLGVPVVRAEAEGEALCALLNAKGVCDGVISNDGDCFLFGAKTLYTKFTMENLESRQVMCYDATALMATVDSDGLNGKTITLSREDLVAFALLTGSDMFGAGLSHVGHKKAVQFLHTCSSLNQRPNQRTCLEELLGWGDVAAESASKLNDNQCDDDGPSTITERCCSKCLHSGSKSQHVKNGCTICGTKPGEGCIVVTSKEKFLRSLREKALKMNPPFAPRGIVNEYFSPNNNMVPMALDSENMKRYIVTPDAASLFNSPMIIKGNTLVASQEYIRETFPHLLARLELWTDQRNKYVSARRKYKPVPEKIEKEFVKQSEPCYEVVWSIDVDPNLGDTATFTFSTIEPQSLVVNSKYSGLCKLFHQETRRQNQQLDREKQFIGQKKVHKRRPNEQREKHFSRGNNRAGVSRTRERRFGSTIVRPQQNTLKLKSSNDVSMLMEFLPVCDRVGKHVDENEAVDSDRVEPLPSDKEDDEDDSFDKLEASIDAGLELKRSNVNFDFYEDVKMDKGYLEASSSINNYQGLELALLDPGSAADLGIALDGGFGDEEYRETSAMSNNEYQCYAEYQQSSLPQYFDEKTPQRHNSRACASGRPSANAMPLLTPNNRERIFCDLGVTIEVTPIVSGRWR